MTRRSRRLDRRLALIALAGVALLVGGCATENVLIVTNESSTQLRVFVRIPGGGISTVTPTPGNSTAIVVDEDGTFYAGAVLDNVWLDRMSLTRELLTRQLADPATRRRLSVDELKELSDRINDMTLEIQRATERPSESVGGCSGTVRLSSGGMFEFDPIIEGVSAATITITDNPAGGFPGFLLLCSS